MPKLHSLIRVLSLLVVMALFLPAIHAQVLQGSLTGTVTDPSGASVPNASVTITNLDTNREFKTVTDSSGDFTVPALDRGMYRVLVEASGFAKAEIANVTVSVSQVSKITAKLEVAKTGTEIVVEAQQSVIQTESAELKSTINRQQLMDMPLPTRNPLDLVKAFAGILSPNANATGGDAFVHGLRGNTTNITQDGINVQDNFVKTSGFFAISAPVVDSIGEFNVTVGGVGADAGFGSAQVSMITQRGTNQYHGAAFWFQRNGYLNANTFFNNLSGVQTPFQLQNRLGGNGGGPVWIPKIYNGKNRTFIFGSYEAYREPRSQPRTRTVMTEAARTGQFSWIPTGASAVSTINLLNIGTVGSSSAKPTINSNTMTAYNAIVPTTGLTDSGCAAGDTRNIRCLTLNLGGKSIQDRYTIRADHQLTSKHSIEFVWNQADFDTNPDFLNGIEPQFPKSVFSGGQRSRRQVFVWAFQSVLSPTKTNEARVGYQRAPVAFAYDYNFADTGGAQVAFSGVTSPFLTSTNLPQGRNTPVRQFIDNFSWVKGSHQMRFGGEYRIVLANSFLNNAVIPRVAVGNNSSNPDGITASLFPGGISAADLGRAVSIFDNLTGLLGSTTAGFNRTSPTSGFVTGVPQQYTPIVKDLSFYAQDSWKVRRNFTVQYGVRYEYQGPYDARNGLVLLPQENLAGLFGPTAIGNFFQPGQTTGAQDTLLSLQGSSNGKDVNSPDRNNFGPFIGFAWDPSKEGKMSVRGSFTTHFVQDGLTFYGLASTGNSGLFSTLTNTVPTGTLSPTNVPLPAKPADTLPVSQKTTFAGSSTSNLWNFNPSLATPYVFEWSLGVQRELWKKYTIEARYVGNHAVKQFRPWNINELNLGSNGLLNEFLNAQKNLNLSAGKNNFSNAGLAGQVPLPIFDKIFQGLTATSTSGYQNSTFVTQLNQNQVGAMFDQIRRSATYRTAIGNNFPLNFFVANPWANQALQADNSGWSVFHGLEVEVNRRFANGFIFLGNYTFSKVLADTTFGQSQNEGQLYQSVLNRGLDKFRAGIDVKHSFGASYLYPLPIGRGRKFFANAPGIVNVLIGGWNINGFTKWSTGAPFTISSNRTTTGSLLVSPATIKNMTQSELTNLTGVFRGGNGVYWLDPASGLLKITGASSTPVLCTAGQTTPCFDIPAPGQFGNTSYNAFTLPHFFNQDLSLVKQTRIHERLTFEIRLEAFNVFNNPNFGGVQSNLDGTTFGQLTSTVDSARGGGVTSRIIQWGARVSF